MINRGSIIALAKLAGSLAVVVIAILSLIPGSIRPHLVAQPKLEHVAAYLLTAAFLTLGYGKDRYPTLIAAGLSVYSVILEIAQLGIPGRHAQVLDVVSSSIGAVIGCSLAWIALRTLSRTATARP